MLLYGDVQGGPPSPEMNLWIYSDQDKSWRYRVNALIDTGATKTCIPAKLMTEIVRNEPYLITGPRKKVQTVSDQFVELQSYYIDIKVACCEFESLHILGHHRDYALIGRDILNLYKITFDGPNKRWEVFKHANDSVA